MRLCSLTVPGRPGVVAGLVDGDVVRPLAGTGVLDVIRGADPGVPGEPVPLADVVLEAPFRPGKIIGIGLNYRAHALETGKEPPAEPLLFAKLPTAVTRPGGPVVHPAYTTELDYEGELAVVIGAEAKDVPAAGALRHVFGYAVMNDVSARDRQREEPQWVRAKGGDTFAPFGPWVTTADEVGDPQDLRIRTWVNGELRQDGSTSDMVFTVAELVAWCSAAFTLEPGDVITTGTPAGVGVGFTPPRFVSPGDEVRVAIDGLGEIRHHVVAPGG